MLPTEKETQGTVKLCDTCTRHLEDFFRIANNPNLLLMLENKI